LELLRELLEDDAEVPFLFGFANTPVLRRKLLNQRLVDVVDECVQRLYRILVYFTKQALCIILLLLVDWHAWWEASQEVATFALQLQAVAVSYDSGEIINTSDSYQMFVTDGDGLKLKGKGCYFLRCLPPGVPINEKQ
jgi:hypothetical protein